ILPPPAGGVAVSGEVEEGCIDGLLTSRGAAPGGWQVETSASGAASIGDLPDAAAMVVRDVHAAIARLSQTHRTVAGLAGARDRVRSTEPSRKYLVLCRRVAVPHRKEDDAESLLRQRRPVPRTVEGDEHSAPIARGELLAVIEEQIHRSPVRGEGRCGALR